MNDALATMPPEVVDKKQYLQDDAMFMSRFIVKNRDGELEQIINGAAAQAQTDSLQDVGFAIARGVHDFVQANFSPKELEQSAREYHAQNGRDTPLNELLRYHIKDGTQIYLHVSPARTIGLQEQLRLLREGLSLLAKKLDSDSELKKVESVNAVSWIVATNPGLLTKMGFTYKGTLNRQENPEYFSDDPRDVGEASISRGDFLKKYLK